MDRTLAADRRPGGAPTTTRTPHLRLRARKPLLVAHLLASGTWLGAVVANLSWGSPPPRPAGETWPTPTTRSWTASSTTSCPPRPSPRSPPGYSWRSRPNGGCCATTGCSPSLSSPWPPSSSVSPPSTAQSRTRSPPEPLTTRPPPPTSCSPPSRPRRSCWPPRSRSRSPNPGGEPGAVGDRAPGLAPQPPLGANVVSLESRARMAGRALIPQGRWRALGADRLYRTRLLREQARTYHRSCNAHECKSGRHRAAGHRIGRSATPWLDPAGAWRETLQNRPQRASRM